jgi:isocitrate dehydrogenase
MATIFAWSGALSKRGELDGLPELAAFGKKLEEASIETLDAGIMTKDLVGLAEGVTPKAVTSIEFIREIRRRLAEKLA